jgi:hypothetical protein
VLPLLLLACNPTVGTFYKRGFRLNCEQWEACDPDDFAAHYSDVDECFDAEWARVGTYIEQYEHDDCTYEPAEAHACLQGLRDIDCDTWMDEDTAPEACYFVWTCPEEN